VKVRLIEPSWYKADGQLKKLKQLLVPSLALPLLAALLPEDVEAGITNEVFEEIDFSEEADIIGITCYSSKALRAYEIADEFRRRGRYVVMGGIHPSLEPEEALEHADTVIIGEAEESWPAFINDFKNSKPRKTYAATNSASLDNLPVPKYSLINHNKYVSCHRSGIAKFLHMPILPIQTSRGCPHACDFCSVTLFAGGRYRMRPVADVVAEIKALKLRGVFFVDDNIFANPQRAKELFKALIPLRIQWIGQGTLNTARDRELLRLAAKSGCIITMAGIESISDNSLQSVGKHVNKAQDFSRYLKVFREEGISVLAFMIFGLDGEARGVFKKTCDFLIANKLTYTLWHPLMPYPKTALYQRLKKDGRLKNEKWWLDKKLVSEFLNLKFHQTAYPQEAFNSEFIHYYRSFYSPLNILRRNVFPPKKRLLGNLILNLILGSRISKLGSILQN
jgi:radical SAM superfamily enzyme YgiQ (UPF0313 family)